MSPATATTRLAGVIGDPVRHSLSPVLFNAAFAALDLDWVFLAFEVGPADLGGAVAGFRSLGLEGLSVTMPHKSAITGLVDGLTPVAERLGAVNSVFRDGAHLVGHNTDGAGFIDSLRAEGVEPAGCRAAVVGAGGAARAVISALGEAGVADLWVLNRSEAPARRAVELAPDQARVGTWADLAGSDLVVNATPVGMAGQAGLAVPEDVIHPGQVVVDLVYHPLETPLLARARARGARAVGGVGMLVHQAGHQLRAWTGDEPPLAVMAEAVRAHLARSSFSG